MLTLTRRMLLSSVAVLALTAGTKGQVSQLGNAPLAFRGNPNATITAINTDGGITCSRTSGQTPAFFQVSASAIAATGTNAPYEDLEYLWDFGDAEGKEIFLNPVTGQMANANTDQIGPEAAYCYRTPGIKQVTLTIRGKNGDGYTIATATRALNVRAFDHRAGGEWWFSTPSKGTGRGNSPANASGSLATLQAKFRTSGTLIHIERGSVFSHATEGLYAQGVGINGVRIDAYGTGPNPVFQTTEKTDLTFYLTNNFNGVKPKTDIVISGIDFRTLGNKHAGGTFCTDTVGFEETLCDIYLDGCTFTTSAATGSAADTLGLKGTSRTGVWKCSVVGTQTPGTGHRTGFNGTPRQWFFAIGMAVSGAGSSDIFDHAIYTACEQHELFRWVSLGSNPMRNGAIKLRVDGLLDRVGHYHLVSDCDLGNLKSGVSFNNADNGRGDGPKYYGRFSSVVVQNNAIHGMSILAIAPTSAESVTIRDNLLWNNSGGLCSPGGTLYDYFVGKCYRNKVYSSSAKRPMIDFTSGAGAWVTPQTITDNIFYFTNADAMIANIIFSDFVSNKSLIDRNQYYAPNDSDLKFLFNNSKPVSFGPAGKPETWQNAGFDRNGSVAKPSWRDPANGNFDT